MSAKKILSFAIFHKRFLIICPFGLYKIFQCVISQGNLSPVLKLIRKQKTNTFEPINSTP